jgi:hypothetical protein
MATTLILSLGITLALAVLLVPAIGTVVFAQNLSGMAGNLTEKAGNMTGNLTEKVGNMTEKAGGMLGNFTK